MSESIQSVDVGPALVAVPFRSETGVPTSGSPAFNCIAPPQLHEWHRERRRKSVKIISSGAVPDFANTQPKNSCH